VVWGVRDHGRTAGRAWKFTGVVGSNTYTIQSQNGNYLAQEQDQHQSPGERRQGATAWNGKAHRLLHHIHSRAFA
jgi:hypothetical protein